MKDPRESMDDQPLLWDIPPTESVAVLSDEQREELRNALMEMLLWKPFNPLGEEQGWR